MKKIIQNLLRVVFVSVLVFVFQATSADGGQVNLIIKNNGQEITTLSMPLSAVGTARVNDSGGAPHDIDARSVLKVLSDADAVSSEFNISNLIYYDSFGAFYLKCIEVSGEDLCDNWQYDINSESPSSGMDQSILSGGETVTLFFGSNEEVAEVPETPVAEEEQVEEAHTSSGSRTGSLALVSEDKKVEVEVEPAPKVELVEQNSVENKITEKVEQKVVPVKKIVKIKKPVVQNTAAVINASDDLVVNSEPEKVSWFGRFLGWLFSF